MDDTNEQRPNRGPRIPKPKIESINTDKKAQIFYKSHNKDINHLLRTFPSEALVVFCDSFSRKIRGDNEKSVTIIGGEKDVYNDIFDWILASVAKGECDEVPTYDQETSNVFLRYGKLIVAAKYLGIPARDFANSVAKSLLKLSRHKFMTWDEVEFYLANFGYGTEEIDSKMRNVVSSSIGNAWWNGKMHVDQDEDNDDLCILSVLRMEHSQLDEDLHSWFEEKKKFVEEKWAQKKREREGTVDGSGNSGDWNNDGDVAAGSGWDTTPAAGCGVGGGWDNAAPAAAGGWDAGGAPAWGGSDKENAAPKASSGWDSGDAGSGGNSWDDGGHGQNWAEEVNDSQQFSN